MAESLKTFFSPTLVRQLADTLVRADPAFPTLPFVSKAMAGLEKLELLDRGRHIARALGEYLPASYPDAVDVLMRSLGPEHATDELVGAGMAPFFYLPHVLFVAERGLDHFDLSLQAQYELTKRFSAEFSIRFFIDRDPERTLAFLERWTRDPNPHVRRLVSEGTRLRLPWAARVPWLDANPRRVLNLLERLKDDPASLVRRSVANNLNDLGKVWPKVMLSTCAGWLKDASRERRALVEHALRSAVKRGNPAALGLLGYGEKPQVTVKDISIHPRRVPVGGNVEIRFSVQNDRKTPLDLLVDLAVHFVKAGGRVRPKVFKLKRLHLLPAARAELKKTVSLAEHTTRVPKPGRHPVDILLNGEARRIGFFQVDSKPRSVSK